MISKSEIHIRSCSVLCDDKKVIEMSENQLYQKKKTFDLKFSYEFPAF